MRYLKEYGLSDEEIDRLYDNLSETEWNALAGARSRVEDIIEYLKEKGIKDIKEVLFEATYIFTYSLDELKDLFNNCPKENIVEKINEDIGNFDLLF